MASFKMTGTLMVIGDKFGVGQEIEVSFNMRGRKWTSPQGEDKYFNSLDAWRVDAVANEESAQPKVADKEEVEDDMPF